MSEAGDYTPSDWSRGHNFKQQTDDYAHRARSTYTKAVNSGVTLKDLVPAKISTNSKNIALIACDHTGSMGTKPSVIFGKFPYLEHEARTVYMGKDVVFSWISFGDANNPEIEKYPLQVRPFAADKASNDELNELVLEPDSGGGTQHETSELVPLYALYNVDAPNAKNPLLIILTDESPYANVTKETAKKIAKVELEKRISTDEIFERLAEKGYSTYIVQFPFNSGTLVDGPLTGTTKIVYDDWSALVGEDHVALLDDANRVVDVIMGIMAKEAKKVDVYYKEIKGRQTKEQVAIASKALKNIHAPKAPKLLSHFPHSTIRKPKD